jgi:hypothetical protein
MVYHASSHSQTREYFKLKDTDNGYAHVEWVDDAKTYSVVQSGWSDEDVEYLHNWYHRNKILTHDDMVKYVCDRAVTLDCSNTKLTKLGDMPMLETLYCYNTGITKLGDMPMLKWLDCYNTGITKLPDMPMLEWLNCSNTGITKLGDMPMLETLYCYNTGITKLPDMPMLEWLYCYNTGITKLDTIPSTCTVYR